MEKGEEVKLEVLIKTPLTESTDGEPETSDDTAGSQKRVRKLTAVMKQSQEQEAAEKEPPKKRKKDGKKADDSHSNTSNKENDNKNKEPKKASLKSKSADMSNKETRKQLTDIANKKAEKAAANEASSHAAQAIYRTFLTTFPGGAHSKESCKETSQPVVVDSGESDAEVEETDGDTADELPLDIVADTLPNRRIIEGQHSLDQLTVISPRIVQEISPVFPPRVSDTGTSRRQLQELFPPTRRLSPSARSGTTLSETAEMVTQAMSSQLNGDDVYCQSGGFSDLLARPLSDNATQERRELISLREENSRLHDEIAILRSQLNSSVRNQPG